VRGILAADSRTKVPGGQDAALGRGLPQDAREGKVRRSIPRAGVLERGKLGSQGRDVSGRVVGPRKEMGNLASSLFGVGKHRWLPAIRQPKGLAQTPDPLSGSRRASTRNSWTVQTLCRRRLRKAILRFPCREVPKRKIPGGFGGTGPPVHPHKTARSQKLACKTGSSSPPTCWTRAFRI